MERFTLSSGVILAALAVMLGAFGAHALAPLLAERVEIWNTGIEYHFYHSLALLVVGILMVNKRSRSKALPIATFAFLLGVLFFSGSLYFIALTQATNLGLFGLITPLGGICFLVGWFSLLYAVLTINFSVQ